MTWKTLLNPDIQRFIREHEDVDVRDLALKKPPEISWPYPLILDQIKARQKAKIKIPLWADHHPDIVFPPSNVLEQASSTATALYKASLIKGKTFADLTGGAGVDSFAFSKYFETGHYIDRDEQSAALMAHNMPLLTNKDIRVHHENAGDFLRDMSLVDLIIIDPQRRSSERKGLYRFEDCSPNILDLLPALKEKTRSVMVKTSPMLDIGQGIKDLKWAIDIHVLEWNGECKEVVYVLDFLTEIDADDVAITAVSINDKGEILSKLSFTKAQEKACKAALALPKKFLYEPGPAFQKSGAFNLLAQKFSLQKLHPHTHLYTSDEAYSDFPGRLFKILECLAVNRKALNLSKANLSIRNFPGSVDILRKKLKIKEGGKDYLFACTLMDESKMLLHCQKHLLF